MPIQLQNNTNGIVTLKSQTSGSFSLSMPSSLGSSGQSIVNDGSGNLSFSTVSSNPTGMTFSTSSTPQATSNIAASGGTSNQGIAICPKGSGGILLNIPDGAAAGGDVRGSYSIDLQSLRSSASNVASGSYSNIFGGSNNTVSGSYSVAIGIGNTISSNSSLVVGNGISVSSAIGSISINNSSASNIGSGYPLVTTSGSALNQMYAGSVYPSGPGAYSLVYPKAGASGTATGVVAETCFGIYNTGSTAKLLNPYGIDGSLSGGWMTSVGGYVAGTIVDEGALVAISETGDCKVWYWYLGGYFGSTLSGSSAVVAQDAGASGWSISVAMSGVTATGGSADTIRWFGWNIGHGVNVL